MTIPEVQQWVVGQKFFLIYFQEKYRLEESLILRFWSDGCSGKFRSRFVLFLLFQFDLEHTIFWYYNERHHGKGPMDGVGGTIKHQIFRAVKSGKVSITNAEYFAAHANAIVNGTKSLYIPIDEVLEQPEDIEKSCPRIDGALEVQKIACFFSTNDVCKLEFLKRALDEQPFHVQYCKKHEDPDVCGHAE